MNRKSIFLHLLSGVVLIAALIFLAVKYSGAVTGMIRDPEEFRSLLLSYGRASSLVFIGFQILQVVIATIPGELVQVAGGYVFGTAAGTLYSALGILTGYLIVFFFSRLIGYPIVTIFVSQDKIQRIKLYFNTKKADIIIFLLFLIPGVPKDFLVYVAGITPVKPLRFFLLTMIARLPALWGSSFIGANLQQENYLLVAFVFGLSAILFIVGFLLKDRIVNAIEARYLRRAKE